MGYFDLIFLAFVAGILLYRLRLLLGRKDLSEGSKERIMKRAQEISDRFAKERSDAPLEKAEFIEVDEEVANESIRPIITQIKQLDKSFTVTHFIKGAKTAFEMIVEAFSKGEKDTLKNLLDNPLYEDFSSIIDQKSKNEENTETSIVGIKSAEITNAELKGKVAYITVKFISDQIDIIKDKQGNTLADNSNKIETVSDVWRFSRALQTNNPNWKLVDTTVSD